MTHLAPTSTLFETWDDRTTPFAASAFEAMMKYFIDIYINRRRLKCDD